MSSATLADPSLAWPNALAVVAAGGLYAVDQNNNDIAHFAAGQTALTTTLNDPSFGNDVFGLMLDPGGDPWASLGAANRVERLRASVLPNTISITDTIGTAGPMAWIP